MTKEEKQKAIAALKLSAPVKAMTQEEFKDYILTLNKIIDWLEHPETVTEFADRCRECGKQKKDWISIPKDHGKIVDLGKIDKDRIESDNPIISLTVNGEYIEAVSLDYLYSLPSIIEAGKLESEA